MTATEFAQAVAEYAEVLAKQKGMEGVQAFVLVREFDGALALGVGCEDGGEVSTPVVVNALLEASLEINRQGWRVEAVS